MRTMKNLQGKETRKTSEAGCCGKQISNKLTITALVFSNQTMVTCAKMNYNIKSYYLRLLFLGNCHADKESHHENITVWDNKNIDNQYDVMFCTVSDEIAFCNFDFLTSLLVCFTW